MGLSDMWGLFKREKRHYGYGPYVAEQRLAAGDLTVDPSRFLSLSAVAARCIAIRSELLASTGLHLYRRTANGGREKATDHPLYKVLHTAFNPNQSAFEGREALTRNLDLRGNAYARIERDDRGEVVALWGYPMNAVGVERLSNGRLRYNCSEPDGTNRILLQDEILHIRGSSRDGFVGQSPLQIAAGSMSLRMAQAEISAGFVNNGLRPSGILEVEKSLSKPAIDIIREEISRIYTSPNNAGKPIILDAGMKYSTLSWTPEDAEFLATTKLGNEDVARLYGVPPTIVGITDKATYSNTEQEGRALVQNCLGPLAARIEAAISRCLLTAEDDDLYVEHDLSVLLRGDMQARFEAYRIAREIGAFSPNDVRHRENEPPIVGGDVYNQPANWVALGAPPTQGGASVQTQ